MALGKSGGVGTNTLDLSPGLNQSLCGNVGECVNELGGNTGHINSSNADYEDAAAHDILHFAGMKDRYRGGKADAAGKRSPYRPSKGYTKGNIMSDRSGTQLRGRQFQEA